MPCRLTFACLILITLNTVARADNWDRFRGPNGNGIASDKNIPIKFSSKENVRWKTKIEGTGNSSPVVWGNRVFLQVASPDATERSLLCLDAGTGKEVWRRSIPGVKVKFRADSSAASATPATDGEGVYIPFWNGKDVIMVAYNFKGDKLWERNLGEFVSQHGAGASPIVYKDLVIFSVDKDAFRDTMKKTGPVENPSTLFAFDKKTGKTVWEMPRVAVRACYSAPYLVEKPGAEPELIVTSTSAITSYDPTTGKSNWNWTWNFPKGALRTIAPANYVNGWLVAYAGDGDGRRFMVGVELKGQAKNIRGEQAWSAEKIKETPYVPCPLVKGEHIYFVGDFGTVGCVEAKTGKRIWFERLQDTKFYSSPVMIDGKIYAPSEGGDVFVFEAEPKYKLLATNSLGEVTRATPAVANGALFIRTQSHLYCIASK